MASESARRVVAWLAAASRRGREPVSTGLLCRTACGCLDVAGASVTLMLPPHPGQAAGAGAWRQEPVAASDQTSAELEELHLTTGEGPASAAVTHASPMLIPNLHTARGRWPGWAPAAVERGAAAVFAFPLSDGHAPIGVLTLHRAQPASLGHQTRPDAHTFAELAAALLPTDPTATAATRPQTGPAAAREQVHQAVGMLAVQLGVGLDEASTRLRTHAFSHDQSLAALARDVLAGHTHLPADPTPNS